MHLWLFWVGALVWPGNPNPEAGKPKTALGLIEGLGLDLAALDRFEGELEAALARQPDVSALPRKETNQKLKAARLGWSADPRTSKKTSALPPGTRTIPGSRFHFDRLEFQPRVTSCHGTSLISPDVMGDTVS